MKMNPFEEIKAKTLFIEELRAASRAKQNVVYNDYVSKREELDKLAKQDIETVEKDIAYLKQEYAKQPSQYPDLDAVIDRIIEGFPLYPGRPERSRGYDNLTVLCLEKGFTYDPEYLNMMKLHFQAKYSSFACNDDLVVFIGKVGCSKADRLVLQNYFIDSKTVSGISSAN